MPLTQPILDWARSEQFGNSKAYQLARSGEIDTIMLLGRRCVVLSSWADCADRQRQGFTRDPEEKAAAARYYRRSADATRARQPSAVSKRETPRRTDPPPVSQVYVISGDIPDVRRSDPPPAAKSRRPKTSKSIKRRPLPDTAPRP